MKKLISILLVAVIAISGLMSVPASAATVKVSDKIAAPILYTNGLYGEEDKDYKSDVIIRHNIGKRYNDFTDDPYYCTLELPEGTKGTIYYKTSSMSKYKKYTKQFKISKNTTLKFYTRRGNLRSATQTVDFKWVVEPVLVYINEYGRSAHIDSGRYNEWLDIEPRTVRKGAEIYYTTDGTTPSRKSKKLEKNRGIIINKDTELKVIAYLDGYTSIVSTFYFTFPNGEVEIIL